MDITTSSLLKDKKLTLKERVLFQYLFDLSNNGEREVRVTYKQINNELGLSQRSLSSLYTSLTEKKLIDVKSDRSGTHIKIYTLVHESEDVKEDKITNNSDENSYSNEHTTYSNEYTTNNDEYTTHSNKNMVHSNEYTTYANEYEKKFSNPLYIYILININIINNK